MIQPRPFHRVLPFLLGLTVALTALGAAEAPMRIGIIDLKKVFDGFYKTKQADTQLKERAADLDKSRQAMMDDYDKAKREFESLRDSANDQALSADERDKRKAAAEKKLIEMRQIEQDTAQFDRTARGTLAEQQRRMRDRILDEIKEVVNSKAKQASLDMVIDVAAESVNQTPVLLYYRGNDDLTTLVLNELNSRGPVDLPPLEGSAAPSKE